MPSCSGTQAEGTSPVSILMAKDKETEQKPTLAFKALMSTWQASLALTSVGPGRWCGQSSASEGKKYIPPTGRHHWSHPAVQNSLRSEQKITGNKNTTDHSSEPSETDLSVCYHILGLNVTSGMFGNKNPFHNGNSRAPEGFPADRWRRSPRFAFCANTRKYWYMFVCVYLCTYIYK